MKDQSNPPSEREQRLNRIIAEYLEARQTGNAPDREELLSQHPDLAAELAEFFADEDQFDHMAESIDATVQHARGAESVASGSTIKSEGQTKVRNFGDYELLEEIARGGMGVVWRARQVSLNRMVALKMIRAGQFADDNEIRRFRDEAEAAANLDHPQIVPIYEVGEHEGQDYFSMKLIEGGNLGQCVDRYRHQPKAIASLLIAVAQAVHHAHQRGILHRDLKPTNILIDQDGKPHVTDFGLAKKLEEDGKLTHSGAIVGTPEYMAPEQARGEKGVTTAVDIYGLGAVMYFLLTGRPPFQSDYNWETLKKLAEHEPDKPRKHNRDIPRDLERICLKCLEKSPGKRYCSAAELADDLQRWLDGNPIKARAAGRIERGIKWTRRHPTFASLIGVVFLGLVSLLVVGHVFNEQLRQQLNLTKKEKQRVDEVVLDLKKQVIRTNRTLFNAQLWRVKDIYQKDPHAARGLLHDPNLCPIPLRSAAWRFYANLCRRDYLKLYKSGAPQADPIISLKRHSNRVTSIAFSSDSSILASASEHVILSDPETGKQKAILKGNPRSVESVIVSPDMKTLALACGIWNNEKQKYTSGEILLAPLQVTVSGSGSPNISWQDSEATTATLKHQGGQVTSIAFSRDSKTLASAGEDGTITLWDMDTHKVGAVCKDTASHLVFSPDGEYLASAGGLHHTIRLWDVRQGDLKKTFAEHAERVNSLSFSPDGRHLASASDDKTIKVWQLEGMAKPVTLRGHKAKVLGAVFNPDNKTEIASCGTDQTIRIWDLKSAKHLVRNSREVITHLAYAPGGRSLLHAASEGFGTIGLSHIDSGGPIFHGLPRPQPLSGWFGRKRKMTHLAFHQGGVVLVAYADPFVSAGRVENGRLAGIRSRCWGLQAEQVYCVSFSPDNKTLASAERMLDQKTKKFVSVIRLWDLKNYVLKATLTSNYADQTTIRCVAFSPDGTTLASASNSNGFGSIKLWDVRTAKETVQLVGHRGILSLAFSPDGKKLVSGGVEDHTVIIWDLQSRTTRNSWKPGLRWITVPNRKKLATLEGHLDEVNCVAFSHDSRRIASGSSDRTIKLWDAASGKELATLRGHRTAVRSIAFSPDNVTLASGSGVYSARAQYLNSPEQTHSTTMKLWDIVTFQEVASLPAHDHDIYSLAFSPDKKTLATASGQWSKYQHQFGAGDIKLWSLKPQRLQAIMKHGRWGLSGVAFSPDSRTFVSINYRDKSGMLWDRHSGQERFTFPCLGREGSFEGAYYSPDSRLIAVRNFGAIELWDVDKGVQRISLSLPNGLSSSDIHTLRFSPHSRFLAANSKSAELNGRRLVSNAPIVWDIGTGKIVTDHHQSFLSPPKVQVQCIDSNASLVAKPRFYHMKALDGKTRLPTVHCDEIFLLDLVSGKVKDVLVGWQARDLNTNLISSWLCFSPDGKVLVRSDAGGTLLMWNLDDK